MIPIGSQEEIDYLAGWDDCTENKEYDYDRKDLAAYDRGWKNAARQRHEANVADRQSSQKYGF